MADDVTIMLNVGAPRIIGIRSDVIGDGDGRLVLEELHMTLCRGALDSTMWPRDTICRN